MPIRRELTQVTVYIKIIVAVILNDFIEGNCLFQFIIEIAFHEMKEISIIRINKQLFYFFNALNEFSKSAEV